MKDIEVVRFVSVARQRSAAYRTDDFPSTASCGRLNTLRTREERRLCRARGLTRGCVRAADLPCRSQTGVAGADPCCAVRFPARIYPREGICTDLTAPRQITG